MSRAITLQTEITDPDLACQALKQAGILYDLAGDQIFLKSGDLRDAVLDLRTGRVQGDSDYGHTSSKFGLLRQYYGEAKARAEHAKNGVHIEQRLVDEEENVILMWSMG